MATKKPVAKNAKANTAKAAKPAAKPAAKSAATKKPAVPHAGSQMVSVGFGCISFQFRIILRF